MKCGVYGLGRFGSFWGARLAEQLPVVGYSRRRRSPEESSIVQVDEEELFECDCIVLCVAISAMEDVCRRIGPLLNPGTVVMDTCSVKVYPVAVMQEWFSADIRIVGTHPMFGPDSGRAGIEGLPIVYSPVRSDSETDESLKTLFTRMGLRIIEMTPDEHDRSAAYTQGITHFLGRVLQDMELEPSPIATLGYNRLLEIIEQTCNDPEQLFIDLQRFNPHTHEMRESLRASLDRFMERLREVPGLPS